MLLEDAKSGILEFNAVVPLRPQSELVDRRSDRNDDQPKNAAHVCVEFTVDLNSESWIEICDECSKCNLERFSMLWGSGRHSEKDENEVHDAQQAVRSPRVTEVCVERTPGFRWDGLLERVKGEADGEQTASWVRAVDDLGSKGGFVKKGACDLRQVVSWVESMVKHDCVFNRDREIFCTWQQKPESGDDHT